MAFSHICVRMKIISTNGDEFTEGFYRASDTLGSVSPTRSGPVLIADDLIVKRKRALVNQFRIRSCSITAAPLPGESSPRKALNFPVANGLGDRTVARDTANTVKNIPILSTTGHLRNYPMHGLADADVRFLPDGSEVLDPGAAVTGFLDYLVAAESGWQMRVVTVAAGDPANKAVVRITVDDDGIVSFVIPGVALQAPGARFFISGCRGFKVGQFNHEWKVTNHDVATNTITASTKRSIDPHFFYEGSSGKFRLKAGGTINFENFKEHQGTISRSSSKKTGNPFDRRRGRRSVRS